MRNKAGFMGLALLLLSVPALANAWNLTVKVAGGDTTNYTTVAYGTTSKDCQSGTFYLYPQVAVTLANHGVLPSSVLLDGIAVPATFVSPTTGSHTLAVTYPAAVVDAGASITLAQNLNGGQLYAQNRNNTWSYTGVTGLANLSSVPVYIVADGNHKIVSYNLGDGSGLQTVVNGAAGQSLAVTGTATTAGANVTATFGLAARTAVSLFAPSNGFTATPVSLSVTATSNDTGLLYAFSVNGAAYSTASANSSFSFTPTTVGTYTVKVKVTSAADTTGVIASANVVVTDAVVNADQGCVSCHSTQSPTIVANYTASIHSGSAHSACSACHTSATPHSAGVNALNIDTKGFFTYTSNVTGPKGAVANGAIFCTQCHSTIPHQTTNLATGINCNVCHTSTTGKGGSGDAHAIQGTSCQGCHAVGQSNPFTDKSLVNDNSGVRAVTGEFTKWSHHIVNAPGVAIQDEQCAVCHLEGTVGAYGFGVDGTKHMIDSVTHLRNAHDDSDMQWDPAAPNHTTMDNFCMACHSATGATSAMNLKLQALITPLTGTTASPSNPFGDTISNQYDKMLRPAVVNVSDQFNTGNNSHHAVKGPRYSGRTRVAGARQIASATAFSANSSATLPGARTTIYDAGKFNALYLPLGNTGGEAAPRTGAATLGDDSTLHCGDCHTVGQFRAADVNVASSNKAVIGAHGSNNEYMLRNSIGTDARHQGIQMDDSATHADAVTPLPGLLQLPCHRQLRPGSPCRRAGRRREQLQHPDQHQYRQCNRHRPS